MKPIAQIVPGVDTPVVTFATNQPEYHPLPAWRGSDGRVVTRWKVSWSERLRILLTGDLWLSVLTFHRALQPVRLDTECPLAASDTPLAPECTAVSQDQDTRRTIYRRT